jgi:hypothetical protein
MDWLGGAPVIDWRKVTVPAAAGLVRRGESQASGSYAERYARKMFKSRLRFAF